MELLRCKLTGGPKSRRFRKRLANLHQKFKKWSKTLEDQRKLVVTLTPVVKLKQKISTKRQNVFYAAQKKKHVAQQNLDKANEEFQKQFEITSTVRSFVIIGRLVCWTTWTLLPLIAATYPLLLLIAVIPCDFVRLTS